MNPLKFTCALGVAVWLTAISSAPASETAASPSLSILKSVPLAELPGRAAALVAAADATNQVSAATDAVKSAVGLNPAAAAAIVGAIAMDVPATAPAAAATAAGLLPAQAAGIARAAAAAAPKQAGKIVEAVCRAVPDSYREIALAVAEVAPEAAREILAGVMDALPNLKSAITAALAAYRDATPSVKLVLAQVNQSVTTELLAGGTSVSSRSVHPVPVPGSGSLSSINPVILDPGQNGQVPTGGRNYANPTNTSGDYSP
jgi:hypothetical protein